MTGSERVFFIFLELTAACLFGTLLGELQVASTAVAPVSPSFGRLETSVQGVVGDLFRIEPASRDVTGRVLMAGC